MTLTVSDDGVPAGSQGRVGKSKEKKDEGGKNGTKSFTLKDLHQKPLRKNQLEHPDSSWSVDRLGEVAQAEHKRVRLYDRKMAVHTYRLGQALDLAHQKVPYGKWGSFLKKYKISEATDWRARKLFGNVDSEKALAGLGINEAYQKWKINKTDEKATHTEEPAPPPKEDELSFRFFLAKVLTRLDYYYDDAAFLDQDGDSPQDYPDLIDEAIVKLNTIKDVILK